MLFRQPNTCRPLSGEVVRLGDMFRLVIGALGGVAAGTAPGPVLWRGLFGFFWHRLKPPGMLVGVLSWSFSQVRSGVNVLCVSVCPQRPLMRTRVKHHTCPRSTLSVPWSFDVADTPACPDILTSAARQSGLRLLSSCDASVELRCMQSQPYAGSDGAGRSKILSPHACQHHIQSTTVLLCRIATILCNSLEYAWTSRKLVHVQQEACARPRCSPALRHCMSRRASPGSAMTCAAAFPALQ